MTTKDNLPEPVKQETGEVVVFQPPAAFEVIDRGPGTVVTFSNFHDTFVGIYDGWDEGTDDDGAKFPIARFMGADGNNYVIFPGAALERALHKLNKGEWARITYTFDVDTGKPSPMKCFTVEVGR